LNLCPTSNGPTPHPPRVHPAECTLSLENWYITVTICTVFFGAGSKPMRVTAANDDAYDLTMVRQFARPMLFRLTRDYWPPTSAPDLRLRARGELAEWISSRVPRIGALECPSHDAVWATANLYYLAHQ
jgi:hypothetical protein